MPDDRDLLYAPRMHDDETSGEGRRNRGRFEVAIESQVELRKWPVAARAARARSG